MGQGNRSTAAVVLTLPSPEQVEESLEPKVRGLREIIQKATLYTEKVEVKTDEAEQEALAISGRMLKSEKALKALKTEVLKPFKVLTNKVGEVLDPLVMDSQTFRKMLNQKLNTYTAFKKAEQARLEAEMKEKQKKLQAEIDASTPEGMEAPQIPEVKAPKVPKTVKSQEGYTSYQKEHVSVEIVRPDLVPRKFCEPSKRLCLAAAKAGVKYIAGVKITREMRTEVRTG